MHRTKTSLLSLSVQLKIEKLKSSPETGSILFFEQSNIYSGVQKCMYYQTLFLLKCAAICNFVKVHGFHKGIFPPLYVLSHHSLYVWKKIIKKFEVTKVTMIKFQQHENMKTHIPVNHRSVWWKISIIPGATGKPTGISDNFYSHSWPLCNLTIVCMLQPKKSKYCTSHIFLLIVL